MIRIRQRSIPTAVAALLVFVALDYRPGVNADEVSAVKLGLQIQL